MRNISVSLKQKSLVDMVILEMVTKGLNRSGERLSEQRIPSRQTKWMFLPSHKPKRIEQHFKMGDLHYLKPILKQCDYMCKLNLKDLYFSAPLNKDSRKMMCFT